MVVCDAVMSRRPSNQRLLLSDGVEVLRVVPANRNPAGATRPVVRHRVQHVGWGVQNVTLARDELAHFERDGV
jgi:hypothetical protein